MSFFQSLCVEERRDTLQQNHKEGHKSAKFPNNNETHFRHCKKKSNIFTIFPYHQCRSIYQNRCLPYDMALCLEKCQVYNGTPLYLPI